MKGIEQTEQYSTLILACLKGRSKERFTIERQIMHNIFNGGSPTTARQLLNYLPFKANVHITGQTITKMENVRVSSAVLARLRHRQVGSHTGSIGRGSELPTFNSIQGSHSSGAVGPSMSSAPRCSTSALLTCVTSASSASASVAAKPTSRHGGAAALAACSSVCEVDNFVAEPSRSNRGPSGSGSSGSVRQSLGSVSGRPSPVKARFSASPVKGHSSVRNQAKTCNASASACASVPPSECAGATPNASASVPPTSFPCDSANGASEAVGIDHSHQGDDVLDASRDSSTTYNVSSLFEEKQNDEDLTVEEEDKLLCREENVEDDTE